MKLYSREKKEHELLEGNDNGIFNDIIGEFSENYKKMKKFQPERKGQSGSPDAGQDLAQKQKRNLQVYKTLEKRRTFLCF